MALKFCNVCGEDKPKDLFGKYTKSKDGLKSQCKTCVRKFNQEYYSGTKDRFVEVRKLNSEQHYKNNRTHLLEVSREYRKKFPERIREKGAHRRAAKRSSIPKAGVDNEFNKFAMQEMHDLARLRTLSTGFNWHVDHMVPLRSSLVCGLHWYHNLQVIPAKDNLAKSNTQWEHKW